MKTGRVHKVKFKRYSQFLERYKIGFWALADVMIASFGARLIWGGCIFQKSLDKIFSVW